MINNLKFLLKLIPIIFNIGIIINLAVLSYCAHAALYIIKMLRERLNRIDHEVFSLREERANLKDRLNRIDRLLEAHIATKPEDCQNHKDISILETKLDIIETQIIRLNDMSSFLNDKISSLKNKEK